MFCITPVLAVDPVEELQQQIDELAKLKSLSEAATTPLIGEVGRLEKQIAAARNNIAKVNKEIGELAESIALREEDLDESQETFRHRVQFGYRALRSGSPLEFLLLPEKDSATVTAFFHHRLVQDRNSQAIVALADELIQLNEDKLTLEDKKTTLAVAEKTFNEQVTYFNAEIKKARDYQAKLDGQIASLTAAQQAIISARAGGTAGVGDVPLADDPKASISWRDQAPANSIAVFSIGAYTHRNGMSQYGARARADAGQSAEEILRAYYPSARLEKSYGSMDSIEVQGYGRMSFEDEYLMSIYEVPMSWPMEVLKAQAIAARTYAIRHTNNGASSICATEACQVYKSGKKGGDWETAVRDTRGWVLVNDAGSPVSTQYASTHGGYINNVGWDTADGAGGDGWTNRAWEAKANSPWFYKAWYRNGYSSSGDSCGYDHPWLSQEEFSDILNAYLVSKDPQGADTGRIQPVTINRCKIGGSSGNPYSMSELRDFANKGGGAVTSISSVSTTQGNNGQTQNVRFQTNRGEIVISGSEFKSIFNLRAPGYLRIPQSSFAFFDVIKK